jgi:hypothetical protein
MPQIYANGGAPNRLGINFTSTTALLTEIETQLTLAGWTTTLNQITANRKLIMNGTTSNGHNCWFRFIVADRAGIPDGKELRISGDHTGTEVTVSPNLAFNFIETATNRLWITADSDSGCIAIESFEATMRGAFFGFPERAELTDSWCWGLGFLNTAYNAKYVAKSAFNNTNWRHLSDDFIAATDFDNAGQTAPFQGVFDRRTVCLKPYNFYNNGGTTENAGRFAQNGSVNGLNNKPFIDTYFLIEGRGSTGNYNSPGNNAPPLLYCRGTIKHAVTGIASAPPRGQYITDDNKVYLSVGGVTWQGFRIE